MRATGRWMVRITAGIVVASLWLISTEPWGMHVRELVPFTGPAATLGLTTAWLAFAADQREWTWRIGLWGALVGAAALPPFLAFMIALAGTAPQASLTAMFVAFAWIALGVGSTAALLRLLFSRSHAPRRLARAWLARTAWRRRHFVPISRGRDR